MRFVLLLGRILFSAIFILKSFEHFSCKMVGQAASVGVPASALLVPLAGVITFLGGLSILLGYRAKIGAWLLVIFLLPTAFIMHSFWKEQNSFSAMMHHYCFWKNISMIGAALMIAYFGSGPLSLRK